MNLNPFSKKEEEARLPPGIEALKNKEPRYLSDNIRSNVEFQKERTVKWAKEMLERELGKLKEIPNRASSMAYFDGIADIFGQRAREVEEFKAGGGKVVGTLCIFAPPELIDAAGAIPVRLCSGIHESVHPANELLGDAGLCPLVRSTLGTKMIEVSPIFEAADLIVGPTPCDGKTKLAEILQDFVPVLILNMPRVKAGDMTRRHWVEELSIMKDRLEELTGARITREKLAASVEKYRQAQLAWRRLEGIRAKADVLWGRDALLVAQVSFFDDIARWTGKLNELCDELENMTLRKVVVWMKGDEEVEEDEKAPRLLLAGSPIVWPNWKVPTLIEESDGYIAADDLCSALRIFHDVVVVEEETVRGLLNAIAERQLYPCTCPCFTPNLERENNIINQVKEYRIEGVVYHVLRGCHLHALDAAKLDKALKPHKVPMLKVESEYDEGDVEQIRTRIEAFNEMIKARRM
jgi:benzoyl-CoA reductase/2-hydroxyglutaryl-CoA dehydratase subunit BcrC/BadD/HgdB